jgi:hypothetical protein
LDGRADGCNDAGGALDGSDEGDADTDASDGPVTGAAEGVPDGCAASGTASPHPVASRQAKRRGSTVRRRISTTSGIGTAAEDADSPLKVHRDTLNQFQLCRCLLEEGSIV